MTARCAQYVSALKIVGLCKRKISRRLRKNLHITILSLFGEAVKLFPKYSIQCDHGTSWPKRYTRTDRPTLWHHRAVKIRRQIITDIVGITDILSIRPITTH